MHYAVNKETNLVKYSADNLYLLQHVFDLYKDDIHNYKILEESGMKVVSRIVYVDGECIYNSKSFWLSDTPAQILENYGEHDVIDFLGKSVDELRFKIEKDNNQSRLAAIEDRAGEVCYNIEVGNEMIALFKEECILTDFQGITPLQIAAKLGNIFPLILTGSFREAKTLFLNLETDPFITEERKQKYIAMLDASDAIEYADSSEYIFTTEEKQKIEDTFIRITTSWSQSSWNSYRNALASIGVDDKYIMIIRHADRDSGDTGVTGDINETGLNSCKTVAEQMKDGTSWTKDGVTYLIDCTANDAHYFSTNYTRTKHTAQALATYRLDTDSAASDYSGITDATEILVAERFLKEPKESGNSELLSKWINNPSSLTQEELTVNLGVNSAEEATTKLLNLANQFTQEILALADKRLNVFVTHDYFLVPMVAAMTNIKCSKTDSNKWLNYEAGLGIILHNDDTFEAFPIRCKSDGYM